MHQHPVFETLNRLHQAFNDKDYDAVSACYHDEAKVIATPHDVGKTDEKASQSLARFRALYAQDVTVSNGDQMVVEVDDVALVLSKLYLANAEQFTTNSTPAMYVFKKNKAGEWRCLIDNFFGTTLLEHV